ncbi:hypothetical protein E2C01_053101 [Portunus trituberculatus]|uniref:Uncharacterized protein n=1 Tax=Portunus trituberculatus TaxID=210409 RepID=A0A5B7GNI7_PORTR|nr:hypothetical protein [Portunus trituberculatus]
MVRRPAQGEGVVQAGCRGGSVTGKVTGLPTEVAGRRPLAQAFTGRIWPRGGWQSRRGRVEAAWRRQQRGSVALASVPDGRLCSLVRRHVFVAQ